MSFCKSSFSTTSISYANTRNCSIALWQGIQTTHLRFENTTRAVLFVPSLQIPNRSRLDPPSLVALLSPLCNTQKVLFSGTFHPQARLPATSSLAKRPLPSTSISLPRLRPAARRVLPCLNYTPSSNSHGAGRTSILLAPCKRRCPSSLCRSSCQAFNATV